MSVRGLWGRSASVVCGLAAAGALYLAAAETVYRQDTVSAVEWAARLDRFAPPAAYFERLAEMEEAQAPAALDKALEANPRLVSARIARALAAEREARTADAEGDLREAARIDRQYLPAWTLANFFYRHHDGAGFWIWTRRAAALTDDFRPLLQLANAWEDRAGAVNADAVLAGLGGGPALERAELDALAARGDPAGARLVARALAARHLPADTPRLETIAGWQIRAGHAADAVETWNALEDTPTLDPAAGRVLTNGDFAQAPHGLGFDWSMPSLPGVAAQWKASRVEFSFSGSQPELCVLLEQMVPLESPAPGAARRIRLRFDYSTSGIEEPTGLRWNLDGEDGPMLPASPGGQWSSVEFGVSHAAGPVAARIKAARLLLLYRREPGSVRARGTVEVRHVRSEKF